MTATQFLEGNAAGAVWLWFSCILGLSLALDILVSRGKELNEKLAGGSLLAVISLGGILANLYVFSVPVTFFTRFFSLLVLVLVHVPLLFAVIAYVHGKKELSKKLAGWFFHGVEIMGLKKHVERCIRGWLPKEPNLPSNKVKMADAKTKVPKPHEWKPFWMALVAIAVIFVVINYFLFHYPLNSVIGGLAIALLSIGAAYYIRFRHSMKVNRIVYICLGLGIGWVMWVLYGITGIGRWVTGTLGVWSSLIIGFAVFYTIGALIGDWIGRKRNYRLPLSP